MKLKWATDPKAKDRMQEELMEDLRKVDAEEYGVQSQAEAEVQALIALNPALAQTPAVQRARQLIHEGQAVRSGMQSVGKKIRRDTELIPLLREQVVHLHHLEEKEKATLSHFSEFAPHHSHEITATGTEHAREKEESYVLFSQTGATE